MVAQYSTKPVSFGRKIAAAGVLVVLLLLTAGIVYSSFNPRSRGDAVAEAEMASTQVFPSHETTTVAPTAVNIQLPAKNEKVSSPIHVVGSVVPTNATVLVDLLNSKGKAIRSNQIAIKTTSQKEGTLDLLVFYSWRTSSKATLVFYYNSPQNKKRVMLHQMPVKLR